MKFKLLAILALGSGLAAVGVGPLHAQSPSRDAGERLSPLDSNPACMERNGPSCVTTETPVRRNAIVPAAPPVTVIRAPDTATRLPSRLTEMQLSQEMASVEISGQCPST